MNNIKIQIEKEASRIEEDAVYSSKSHFNAGTCWTRRHFILGVIATLASATAGITGLLDDLTDWKSYISSFSALLAAMLTALLTFVKPDEYAINHKNVGGFFLELKNQIRIFRNIELPTLDEQTSTERLKEFDTRRNELNQTSPIIPEYAFHKARNGIESGESIHIIDKVKEDV